jgi:hypothetical protein
VASTLNFRNSEPAVGYKLSRIVSMQESAEANNKLGSDLGNEANQFLQVPILHNISYHYCFTNI